MNDLSLLNSPLNVINVGLESFNEDLKSLDVPTVQLDWRPPANGDAEINEILTSLYFRKDVIDEANKKAIDLVLSAEPVWIDVGLAKDVIPGFTEKTLTHAGPPVTWEKMCGPMKGAVIGALIYEGRAKDADEAMAVAASGEYTFAPCHHFGAVGPMTGVISASMPVIVIENKFSGNKAYSTFNTEGRGKPFSFGAYGEDTQEMLRFLRDVVAPNLGKAVRASGGIDLKSIIARALHMGDDCHNRLVGATSILWRELVPYLAEVGASYEDITEIGKLIRDNDWFFLNYSMAACKATLDSARNIPMSTLVTAMARNGVEVGIQISGLGNQWFTAPAPNVKGVYFPGYTEEDANPDIGDSAITETAGLGGFAMAAALSMTQLVGGSISDAIGFTKTMSEITIAESRSFTIPLLGFQGTPTGIDLLKVLETGISPVINTGIAHREAGAGIIGAGIVNIPFEAFVKALKALASE